jgi:hypothetical protein
MTNENSVIAVFESHLAAEAAVRKLAASGFAMDKLSIIGKGYHTDEKVTGFYNVGDKMRIWGGRGAFWGGLWGLFFGGMFMAIPVVGHVVILGYLAAVVISAVEGAVVVGGLGVIGAALTRIGVPNDSVLSYETVIKADGFLVMAHGSDHEMTRAKDILGASGSSRIEAYQTPATAATESHVLEMQP